LLVQACFMRGPDVSGTLEGAGGSRGVLAVLKDASTWKAVAADTLGNAIAAIGSPEVKEQAEKNLKALGRGVKRAVTDIPDDVKEIAKGIASAASKAVDPETYIEMADAIAMLYKCRQNPCCWKKLMESLGEMPSATLEAAARKLKDLGNLKQEEVFEMLGKEWGRTAMAAGAAELRLKGKERVAQQRKKTLEQKHGTPDYEEPASEEYAKWKAKELEKKQGKDARRAAHDKSKAEEIDPNKNSTMTTMKSDQEKNIQLFVRDGNFLKAQRLANDLIKLAPENPKNWATKGWVMYEKKDFKAAIKAFENAIHLKPNAPTTLYFLALSREQIGDLAGAVEAYSLSHKLKPKADTLIGIGLIKKYKGETNAANELFREALKLDPTSELATNLLSDIAPG